jgi:hypothetical protein
MIVGPPLPLLVQKQGIPRGFDDFDLRQPFVPKRTADAQFRDLDFESDIGMGFVASEAGFRLILRGFRKRPESGRSALAL